MGMTKRLREDKQLMLGHTVTLALGLSRGLFLMDTLGGLADELTFTLYPFISSAQDGCSVPSHSSQKCWGFPRPQQGLPEALPVSVSTLPTAKTVCPLGSNIFQCSKDVAISHKQSELVVGV